MRVYELARELDLDTRSVLEIAASLGIEVSSPLGGLDDADADRIRLALAGPVEPATPKGPPVRPMADLVAPHDRKDFFASLVYALIIAYLVLNRIVPDRFVVPVGFSIRPYEVVMGVLLVAWVWWMIVSPKPLPNRMLGLVGLLLLTVLIAAPVFYAPTMTPFQLDGAERGVVRLILMAGLFLASYHMATRPGHARKILMAVIGLTAFQSLLGVIEKQMATPLFFFDDLARALGFVEDPKSIRGEFTDVFERLTGEVRSVVTAPHPIVLSAVIALAIMAAAGWIVSERGSKRVAWLGLMLACLALGLPAPNSRTGFVMLALALIPLVFLAIRHLPRVIPMMAAAVFLAGLAFALSPETPRLLLNSITQPDEDPNFEVRVERFQILPQLVSERPLVGAGYLTHDPEIQIWDNAYNLAMVETGVLGLALTILFFLMAIGRCWSAYTRARTYDKPLIFAGVAAGIALLTGGITFDAWTFDQFLPTSLILMGLGTGTARTVEARTPKTRPVPAARQRAASTV